MEDGRNEVLGCNILSNGAHLLTPMAWQQLSAAIERGDCATARDRLNEIASYDADIRELVERGRYSLEAGAFFADSTGVLRNSVYQAAK